MQFENSPAVEQALGQLRQQTTTLDDQSVKSLVGQLKKERKFHLASLLLNRLHKKHPRDLRIGQELALCTYKNQDAPADIRYDEAIKILEAVDQPLRNSSNLETLGLMGSIYKRKWIQDNQIRDLRTSRTYYMRAYHHWLKLKEQQEKEGIEIDILQQDRNVDDNGFNAINTIYMTDLLAFMDIEEANKNQDEDLAQLAKEKLVEANHARKRLIHYLPHVVELTRRELAKIDENTTSEEDHAKQGMLQTKLYWLHATLAEAYFGLHDFEEAAEHLRAAKKIKGSDSWEYETFGRQLASLTQIHVNIYGDKSEEIERKAKGALRILLDKDAAIDAIFIGRVGLALSGGGFRASLFHIGMFARLAELDVLRHVEVLSCVSGGSIIGAYYYLELKKLLEEKKDEEIVQQDYVDLVKRVEKNFLSAIQCNIRNRIFGSVPAVLKLIFSARFTTSKRLAELYETFLYKPLLKKGQQSLKMNDLFVQPKGDPHFQYKRDNWKRKNKIPNLVINATPLNTGHNWQFTASWMGEPPGSIIEEVDAKSRLKRMYYWEAPGEYKDINLGQAVAASAGVPGVIEPLEMEDLYKRNIKVQLVDGGVHDNQGIVGLHAQECQVFFVSDASGQLNLENQRLGSMLKILLRSNNIMMERIRECQYLDLRSRLESNLIKGMMFVHLRKELEEQPVGWRGYKAFEEDKASIEPVTQYGINKQVQKLLASVRTDLDAFNDREAYALMYSGYQMTKFQYKDSFGQRNIFKNGNELEGTWDFMKVAKEMGEKPSPTIIDQLTISQQVFNKHLRFFPKLYYGIIKSLKWGALGGGLYLLYSVGRKLWTEGLESLNHIELATPNIVLILTVLIGLIIIPFTLRRVFAFFGYQINTKFFRVLLTLFGIFLYWCSRAGQNWLYLKKGKIKN